MAGHGTMTAAAASAASAPSSFETIVIPSIDPEDEGFELQKLGRSLGNSPSLRRLRMRPFGIALDLRAASLVLRHTRQIVELDISAGGAGAAMMAAAVAAGGGAATVGLADFAQAIQRNPVLERLTFDFLQADPEGLLQNALLALPRLRDVTYTARDGRAFFFEPDFVRNLICKPSMQRLSLASGTLSVDQMAAICEGLQSYSYGAASSNQYSSSAANSERSAAEIWCTIMDNSLAPFAHLELRDCRISFPFADSLAQALVLNHSLKSLLLHPSHAEALDESGLALGHALGQHPSLCELDIATPRLSTVEESLSWAQLLTGLVSSRTLTKLDLHRFHWTEEMCIALRLILEKDTLVSLRIEGLRSLDAWLALLPCLAVSHSLLSLTTGAAFENHEDNNITTEDIFSKMGAVLESCRALESLSLSFARTRYPLSFVVRFIGSLRQNSRLRVLTIDFGSIRYDASVTVFINTFKNNYSIVQFSGLGLTHSPANATAAEFVTGCQPVLGGILAMNQTGRNYILRDATDKRRGIQVMATVKSNLDCIFLHLHENPFLCYRRQAQ